MPAILRRGGVHVAELRVSAIAERDQLLHARRALQQVFLDVKSRSTRNVDDVVDRLVQAGHADPLVRALQREDHALHVPRDVAVFAESTAERAGLLSIVARNRRRDADQLHALESTPLYYGQGRKLLREAKCRVSSQFDQMLPHFQQRTTRHLEVS